MATDVHLPRPRSLDLHDDENGRGHHDVELRC